MKHQQMVKSKKSTKSLHPNVHTVAPVELDIQTQIVNDLVHTG